MGGEGEGHREGRKWRKHVCVDAGLSFSGSGEY